MVSILKHLLEKCKDSIKWWGSKLIESDTYNYYKNHSYYSGCLKGGPM